MNYTKNYRLPQWVKEDRIMMDDFNASVKLTRFVRVLPPVIPKYRLYGLRSLPPAVPCIPEMMVEASEFIHWPSLPRSWYFTASAGPDQPTPTKR